MIKLFKKISRQFLSLPIVIIWGHFSDHDIAFYDFQLPSKHTVVGPRSYVRFGLSIENRIRSSKSTKLGEISASFRHQTTTRKKESEIRFFRNRKIAIFDAIFAPTSAFFLHQTHRKAFLPHRMTGQKF